MDSGHRIVSKIVAIFAVAFFLLPCVGFSAFQFDGTINSQMYIQNTGGMNPGTAPYTIAFWVKEVDASTAHILIRNWDGSGAWSSTWQISTESATGRVVAMRADGVGIVTGTTNVCDGNWHHIIVQRESDRKRHLYVDGAEEGTAAVDSAEYSYVCPWWIGASRDNDRAMSSGALMEDIRVWSGSFLSNAQIATLYNSGAGTRASINSETVWWKGGSAHDSAHSYDLALGSTTTFSTITHIPRLPETSSCWDSEDCTTGYCVHNICRSSSTYCGDTFCDAGENCSLCQLDCGTCSQSPTTPTGPETTPVGQQPSQQQPISETILLFGITIVTIICALILVMSRGRHFRGSRLPHRNLGRSRSYKQYHAYIFGIASLICGILIFLLPVPFPFQLIFIVSAIGLAVMGRHWKYSKIGLAVGIVGLLLFIFALAVGMLVEKYGAPTASFIMSIGGLFVFGILLLASWIAVERYIRHR